MFPSQIKNKVPATLSREDLQNKTIKDLQTQLHKVLSTTFRGLPAKTDYLLSSLHGDSPFWQVTCFKVEGEGVSEKGSVGVKTFENMLKLKYA